VRILLTRFGRLPGAIAAIGNNIPPGFTASKISLDERGWSRATMSGLALILLPHNYINYWLPAVAAMEPGDASGTALYDVARRAWSPAAFARR